MNARDAGGARQSALRQRHDIYFSHKVTVTYTPYTTLTVVHLHVYYDVRHVVELGSHVFRSIVTHVASKDHAT